MRPLIAVAFALPLAVAVSPIRAQEGVIPLDSAAVAALASLRERIDGADELRLRGPSGLSVLVVPRLVPSGLGYRTLVGPDPRLDGHDFVLQARGRATETGATVGAIVAGLMGVAVGSVFSGLACLDVQNCDPPRFESAATVGVLGAAAGGLIGAVIGSRFRKWRTIYRHEPFVQDYRYPSR
jgi:hypothetical protein